MSLEDQSAVHGMTPRVADPVSSDQTRGAQMFTEAAIVFVVAVVLLQFGTVLLSLGGQRGKAAVDPAGHLVWPDRRAARR